MLDKVSLEINGMHIEHFISYEIDSDLYIADDAFHMELANPEIEIEPGQQCKLYVNNLVELNGIIERVDDRDSKSGTTLSVEGRDLMGLLVSSRVEEFVTLKDKKLKGVAEELLKNINFINRKGIIYGEGGKDDVRKKEGDKVQGESFDLVQAEPGQTIFQVLKDYAAARGLLFYSKSDGTLVFGKPVEKGEAKLSLIRRLNGKGNNVVSSSRSRNISGRYRKVTVLGQRQGADNLKAAELSASGVAEDKDFPFYKPYVTTAGGDVKDLKSHAEFIMDKQKRDGERLNFSTAGHRQNDKNWQVNELVRVIDERRGIDENMLITGRVFKMSKDSGTTTDIRVARLKK
ncbi:MAG: hypothetical protein OEV42_15180 [Deltaproteobacteria bacterium]|nr:hypothetical protein [Deltaproteobacteria bacterium]